MSPEGGVLRTVGTEVLTDVETEVETVVAGFAVAGVLVCCCGFGVVFFVLLVVEELDGFVGLAVVFGVVVGIFVVV